MDESEFAQGGSSGGGQPDPNFALVVGAGPAGNSAGRFETIHEFDGAVMLDEEPGC